VGRHTAGDGTGVDPIVAAALERRPGVPGPAVPRHLLGFPPPQLTGGSENEGGLGWPGEPGTGTGLGWPVDALGGALRTDEHPAVALVSDQGASDELPRRRRWRRLFGGNSTAA
jgi:hypothetical protein